MVSVFNAPLFRTDYLRSGDQINAVFHVLCEAGNTVANLTALSQWGMGTGRMERIYYRGDGGHIPSLEFRGAHTRRRPSWYFGSNQKPAHQPPPHAVPQPLSIVTAVPLPSIIKRGSFPHPLHAAPSMVCTARSLPSPALQKDYSVLIGDG